MPHVRPTPTTATAAFIVALVGLAIRFAPSRCEAQPAPPIGVGPYSSAPPAATDGAPTNFNAPLPGNSAQAAGGVNPEPAPFPESPASLLLPPRDEREPLKLPMRGGERSGDADPRSGGGILTVFGSLILVIGLFLLAMRVMKRGLPAQVRSLPKEAVEILGRTALPARRQGYLIRVGNKIVLVGFSSSGCEVITEIDDSREVDRLAGICFQADPHGATQSFRGVVEQFFREKPGSKPRPSAPAPGAEEADVA